MGSRSGCARRAPSVAAAATSWPLRRSRVACRSRSSAADAGAPSFRTSASASSMIHAASSSAPSAISASASRTASRATASRSPWARAARKLSRSRSAAGIAAAPPTEARALQQEASGGRIERGGRIWSGKTGAAPSDPVVAADSSVRRMSVARMDQKSGASSHDRLRKLWGSAPEQRAAEALRQRVTPLIEEPQPSVHRRRRAGRADEDHHAPGPRLRLEEGRGEISPGCLVVSGLDHRSPDVLRPRGSRPARAPRPGQGSRRGAGRSRGMRSIR